MLKTALSYSFIAYAFLQGLCFLRPLDHGLLVDENRYVHQLPSKPRLTQNGIKQFFKGLEDFQADRLLLRKRAIDLNNRLNLFFDDAADLGLAFSGRDGWLFLGNNHERCVEKLTGLLSPDVNARSFSRFRKTLKAYSDRPLFFILAPNKSSIYPEKLPAFIQPAVSRYSAHLLKILEKDGVMVYDPTEDLLKNKNKGFLYYGDDTHWNRLGASVAAEGFLKVYKELTGENPRSNMPPYELLAESDRLTGDLRRLIGAPPLDGLPDNYSLHWDESQRPVLKIDSNSHRLMALTEIGEAPSAGRSPFTVKNSQAPIEKRVWFFGDSFSSAFSAFVSAIFSEVCYASVSDLGKDSIRRQMGDSPDLVIVQLVERNL